MIINPSIAGGATPTLPLKGSLVHTSNSYTFKGPKFIVPYQQTSFSGAMFVQIGDYFYYFGTSNNTDITNIRGRVKTGIWENTTDIPTLTLAVGVSTAAGLAYFPEDEVIFFGSGTNNATGNQIYYYKIGSSGWVNITSSFPYKAAGYNFAQVVRHNGVYHFFCASNAYLSHASYNLSTNTWTNVSNYNVGTNNGRAWTGACSYNGNIYIASYVTKKFIRWNGSSYTLLADLPKNSTSGDSGIFNNMMVPDDKDSDSLVLFCTQPFSAGFDGYQYSYSISNNTWARTFSALLY